MSNCPITLKVWTQRNSLNRRVHMEGEYGLYGKIMAIMGKYVQIRVSKAKCE